MLTQTLPKTLLAEGSFLRQTCQLQPKGTITVDQTEAVKRPYEVVILMHPDSTLQDQKDLFNKNKGILQGFKGSFHTLETWGKRTLANPIGKTKKAVYFHATFEAQPAAIAELERTMRINDKVLRFMHTKLDVRVPLSKFMENFRKGLTESAQREREKEAKMQARRAAAQAARSHGDE
jgi:small subunit ribosomal protein S6